MRRHYLLLGSIIVFAAILRLWQLGNIPAGVTNDEMGYIYNSYSIAKTGKNIFGELLPFLTWVNRGGFPFLPIPTYIPVPFFWLFGLSATVGRLPSALLGILDVFFLYIFVKQIFNRPSLALLSAFFLTISPWHLHLSRSAYDPNFSLFFYLFGIVIFIYEIRKQKLPLFSSLAFLLAIFSYRGMNIIFLPLVAILIWYGIKVLKMSRMQLITFSIGMSLIVLSLFSIIAINGKAYLVAEGSLLNKPGIQEEIDMQIREAQGPIFIRRLFLNKPTYIISKLRENYIKAYSPEFLFLYTEPNKIYSIWSRGRIYFLDLILIILGIPYLYKINRNGVLLVSILVLIGGLPGVIGGLPYSARNFFLSALFPILSAGGVLFSIHYFSNIRLKQMTIVVLILSFAYVFGSYLFDYYGRYALYGAEPWFKSLKDISYKVLENRQKYNRVIVGTSSFVDLLQYAFYAKINPLEVQKSWREHSTGVQESFSVQNVAFTASCLDNGNNDLPSFKDKPVMYIIHESCDKAATPSALIKDYFGNTVWKVYRLE